VGAQVDCCFKVDSLHINTRPGGGEKFRGKTAVHPWFFLEEHRLDSPQFSNSDFAGADESRVWNTSIETGIGAKPAGRLPYFQGSA
jgi:hypothetical protein